MKIIPRGSITFSGKSCKLQYYILSKYLQFERGHQTAQFSPDTFNNFTVECTLLHTVLFLCSIMAERGEFNENLNDSVDLKLMLIKKKIQKKKSDLIKELRKAVFLSDTPVPTVKVIRRKKLSNLYKSKSFTKEKVEKIESRKRMAENDDAYRGNPYCGESSKKKPRNENGYSGNIYCGESSKKKPRNENGYCGSVEKAEIRNIKPENETVYNGNIQELEFQTTDDEEEDYESDLTSESEEEMTERKKNYGIWDCKLDGLKLMFTRLS